MGEAKRRASQGLPPREKKRSQVVDDSPRIVSWLPLTRNQAGRFVAITTKGAWIGIGGLALLWVVMHMWIRRQARSPQPPTYRRRSYRRRRSVSRRY
jgi:hypothetical protein